MVATRQSLPTVRESVTHKFQIMGHEGYLTVGMFDDGSPGEMFIRIADGTHEQPRDPRGAEHHRLRRAVPRIPFRGAGPAAGLSGHAAFDRVGGGG